MTQITMNALPAKTWRWLQVNESAVSLPDSFDRPDISVRSPRDVSVTGERGPAFSGVSAMGAAYAEALASAAPLCVGTKQRQEEPAVLTLTLQNGQSAGLRLFLDAGENALLKVVLLLRSGRKAGGLCALETTVRAAAGARVELYTVNLLGDGFVLTDDVSAGAEEKAVFSLQRIDLGGKNVHTAACVSLEGRTSHFESGIVYQVDRDGLMDMNWLARHIGRKTTSHIQASGVLEDSARKCFRGTIDFIRGCAGAKGAETESVLLMGEGQINQTVPLILCEEEDVDGSHGASIGRLDDKMLFYLATRGLSEEQARKLIARSRVDLMCSAIPDAETREAVDAFMAEGEEAS